MLGEEPESSSMGNKEPWKVLEGGLWKSHSLGWLLERVFWLLLCRIDNWGKTRGREAVGEGTLL